MDLTFQVPIQSCSLQHGTYFQHQSHPQLGVVFALAPSLHSFWSIFLHSSPVAYWALTDLGSSSFSVLSFCLFILFMGFSRQEYWSGLPFPSPVGHVWSELSTMTHLSWMAPNGTVHSFIELDKAVVRVIRLASFLWLWFSVCLPLMEKDKRPKKKKCKKAKWLSEEAFQIAENRREVKGKGEKERYTHLNAEYQRIARGDKKAFLSDQWKEVEENNRMGKTWYSSSRKLEIPREHFMQRWVQ